MIRLIAPLRLVRMLVTGASFPLALVYLLAGSAEVIAPAGWMLVAVVLGGVFWSIFAVVFEQRYFPSRPTRAALDVAVLLGHGSMAAALGRLDVSYGAYSVMASSLSAQLVFFLVMLGLFWGPRRAELFAETSGRYAVLLVVGGLSVAGLLAIFYPAIVAEFRSEPSAIVRCVYVALFFVQAGLGARNFVRHNMFQYDAGAEKEERDRALETWGVPIALVMISSIIAALVVVYVYRS